jgi:NTP pyrophosphatase (non-canonical NTP hydrolase)
MTEIYRSEENTKKPEKKKGRSSMIPFGSEEWFEQAAAIKGDPEVQKNIAKLLLLAFDTKNVKYFY